MSQVLERYGIWTILNQSIIKNLGSLYSHVENESEDQSDEEANPCPYKYVLVAFDS